LSDWGEEDGDGDGDEDGDGDGDEDEERDGMADGGMSVGGLVDAAIGVIAPERANRRDAARFAIRQRAAVLAAFHEGADTGRTKADWTPSDGSADAVMRQDLGMLRRRSRAANVNYPLASGMTETAISQEVGTGLKLQPDIDGVATGASAEAMKAIQGRIKRGWRAWSPWVDYCERLHWPDLQVLYKRQLLESGEALLVRRMEDRSSLGAPYSLCWQFVEPDRLATPAEYERNKRFRMGVELGARGEPAAYWILKEHPGDVQVYTSMKSRANGDFERVPARDGDGRPNVLHVFRQLRPGQARGYPWFTPILGAMNDLHKYLQAEWVRKRIAACFSLFIKQVGDAAGMARGTSTTPDEADSGTKRLQELSPGMIWYGEGDEEPTVIDPDIPGDSFEPFVNSAVRFIGAAVGFPPMWVDQNWRQVNYSSARAAILNAYRIVATHQSFDIAHVYQPIYELFVEELMLRGEIHLWDWPRLRGGWCRSRWFPDRARWVDPQKEGMGEKLEFEGKLKTLSQACAERGADWEEMLEQIAAESAKMKELGLGGGEKDEG